MENIWYIQVWNWEMHLVCSFTQLQQRTSDRQLLAFRICQNRLIHQTAWKSLNMCQILAHWQFTTIQSSFLRRVSQSESCWVLSNRNSPVHKSGPPFCSCKSQQLKKRPFSPRQVQAEAWPWHQRCCCRAELTMRAPEWSIPGVLSVGIQGTHFGMKDLNLTKEK